MNGLVFQREEAAIRASLGFEENMADIQRMYALIVQERLRSRHDTTVTELDETIGLIVLCFMGWPGKTAQYRREIVTVRKRFRGIADDHRLQQRFRGALTPQVISAQSVDELTLNAAHDTIHVDRNEDGPGSGAIKPWLPTGDPGASFKLRERPAQTQGEHLSMGS